MVAVLHINMVMSQTIPMNQQKNIKAKVVFYVKKKEEDNILLMLRKKKTTMFLEKNEQSIFPYFGVEMICKRIRFKFSVGFCGK